MTLIVFLIVVMCFILIPGVWLFVVSYNSNKETREKEY